MNISKLIIVIGLLFNSSYVFCQKVIDIDGNNYQGIVIGSQVWLNSDLRVSHYNNGDSIFTTDTLIFAENEPKYQWKYYYSADTNSYCRLYTHYVVTDQRKLCPVGWHVPSKLDWNELINYLGGPDSAFSKLVVNVNDIQDQNSIGFFAIPTVARKANGEYDKFAGFNWWSSNDDLDETNILTIKYGSFGKPYGYYNIDSRGLPVRCIKD